MNNRDLKKLSKSQLIKLLLRQEKKVSVVNNNNTKPKRPNRLPPPIPKGVKPFIPTQTVKRKQKVVDDRPGWIRNPDTNRWIKIDGRTYQRLYPIQHVLNKIDKKYQEINKQSSDIDDKYKSIMSSLDDDKPVPLPRTKTEQTDKALEGYTKSYEINIINNKDPLMQLQNTIKAVAYHITSVLKSMKGLKFV